MDLALMIADEEQWQESIVSAGGVKSKTDVDGKKGTWLTRGELEVKHGPAEAARFIAQKKYEEDR